MELSKAANLARSLMSDYGLNEWSFRMDRAKARHGQTKIVYSQGGAVIFREISLSENFVLLNPESVVRETIKHEIAHALVGPDHKHDYVWQTMAASMGVRPRATKQSNLDPGRFLYECPNGHKMNRHRRITKRVLSCSQCSPVFNTRYLFKLVQNGR